jgi:hypothetical protein
MKQADALLGRLRAEKVRRGEAVLAALVAWKTTPEAPGGPLAFAKAAGGTTPLRERYEHACKAYVASCEELVRAEAWAKRFDQEPAQETETANPDW